MIKLHAIKANRSVGCATAALLLALAAHGPAAADKVDLQFDESVVIYGPERGCRLGEGVTGGDFDGDGIDDLLLGAPWSDGPEGERQSCGAVYLFFGSPERGVQPGGIDPATADLVIMGGGREEQLGRHVTATDIDGDGRDELILGAMYADGEQGNRRDCGGAFIFFGRSRELFPPSIDLAETRADLTVLGAGEKDFLTGELAVGDVNGDGLGDMVLGAFYGDGPENDRYHAGEVAIVFGRARDLFPDTIDLADGSCPMIYGAEATDTFGRAIAVGDLDGDGRGDVIVGAYYGDGPDNTRINGGETYVMFGRDESEFPGISDLSEGAELVIFGERDGDVSGRSIASADMDGDGLDEILISAHKSSADFDLDPRGNHGQLYVIYGAERGRFPGTMDLRTDADCRVTGTAGHDNLGWPVVTGDWDGDGRADLLVIAKQSSGDDLQRNGAGQAYLIKGWDRGERLESITINAAAALSIVGSDEKDYAAFAAALLDWDGDGRSEICLGIPHSMGADNSSPQTGDVNILFTPAAQGDR